MSVPDDFRTGPDWRARSARRRRLARLAIYAAIVIAGAAVSLWLLGPRSTLAMAAFWLALFVAVTAFAILQRETHR